MNIETMSPEAILEQWDNQYEQRHYFSNKSREINFLIEEADNVFNALSTLTEAGIVVSINEEDKIKLKDIIHQTIENIKQWLGQIKEKFVNFINTQKERFNEKRIERLKEKIKKCEEKQKNLKSNNKSANTNNSKTSAKGESAILIEADDENDNAEEDGNVIFTVSNPVYLKVSNDLEKICGVEIMNELMEQMIEDPDAVIEKINKANEGLKNYKENFKFQTAGDITKDDISFDDLDKSIGENILRGTVDGFALTNKILSGDIVKFNADIDLYNQTINSAEKMMQKPLPESDGYDAAKMLKILNSALKLDKDMVSFLASIVAQETKILNKNAKGIAYLEREVDKFLAA